MSRSRGDKKLRHTASFVKIFEATAAGTVPKSVYNHQIRPNRSMSTPTSYMCPSIWVCSGEKGWAYLGVSHKHFRSNGSHPDRGFSTTSVRIWVSALRRYPYRFTRERSAVPSCTTLISIPENSISATFFSSLTGRRPIEIGTYWEALVHEVLR